MANSLIVVLDADVLVPILSCDLLLSAMDHELFQPVVTPMILDEVGGSLRSDFPHLPAASTDRRVEQVRSALSFHTHPTPHSGGAVQSVNPKDRHVAAIAVSANADVVVSNDGQLRRQLRALRPPVRAVTADEFATSLTIAAPDQMQAVIASMASKRQHPPRTVDQLLGELRKSFPLFVAEADAKHS